MKHKIFLRLLTMLDTSCAYLLIACIYCIRPLLGPMNICPYTIGCTQYALMQLKEQPVLRAIKNITQRLLTCHPFRRVN